MFASGWMVLLAMAAWEEHRSRCSAGWRAGCVGMRSKARSDILRRPGAYQALLVYSAYVLVILIVHMGVAFVSPLQDVDARCGLIDEHRIIFKSEDIPAIAKSCGIPLP